MWQCWDTDPGRRPPAPQLIQTVTDIAAELEAGDFGMLSPGATMFLQAADRTPQPQSDPRRAFPPPHLPGPTWGAPADLGAAVFPDPVITSPRSGPASPAYPGPGPAHSASHLAAVAVWEFDPPGSVPGSVHSGSDGSRSPSPSPDSARSPRQSPRRDGRRRSRVDPEPDASPDGRRRSWVGTAGKPSPPNFPGRRLSWVEPEPPAPEHSPAGPASPNLVVEIQTPAFPPPALDDVSP